MKRDSLKLVVITFFCASIAGCGSSSESQRIAGQAMEKKVKRCGNSYFTKIELGTSEIKGFEWKVSSRTLSEADRLNGWEFIGEIDFDYSAARTLYKGGKCWPAWEKNDGYLNRSLRTPISKKREQWAVEDTGYAAEALDCSAIPRLPDCP